jgi:hypothetical protein
MKGDKSVPDSTKVKASRHKEKEEEKDDTGGVVRDTTLEVKGGGTQNCLL